MQTALSFPYSWFCFWSRYINWTQRNQKSILESRFLSFGTRNVKKHLFWRLHFRTITFWCILTSCLFFQQYMIKWNIFLCFSVHPDYNVFLSIMALADHLHSSIPAFFIHMVTVARQRCSLKQRNINATVLLTSSLETVTMTAGNCQDNCSTTQRFFWTVLLLK